MEAECGQRALVALRGPFKHKLIKRLTLLATRSDDGAARVVAARQTTHVMVGMPEPQRGWRTRASLFLTMGTALPGSSSCSESSDSSSSELLPELDGDAARFLSFLERRRRSDPLDDSPLEPPESLRYFSWPLADTGTALATAFSRAGARRGPSESDASSLQHAPPHTASSDVPLTRGAPHMLSATSRTGASATVSPSGR